MLEEDVVIEILVAKLSPPPYFEPRKSGSLGGEKELSETVTYE
jgi:hypothetical protein